VLRPNRGSIGLRSRDWGGCRDVEDTRERVMPTSRPCRFRLWTSRPMRFVPHRILCGLTCTGGSAFGYTSGMKTAISLPDELFSEAEQMAAQLQVSRSELYSRALSEFLARHTPDRVTDALDTVCKGLDTKQDRFAESAARHTLQRSEW